MLCSMLMPIVGIQDNACVKSASVYKISLCSNCTALHCMQTVDCILTGIALRCVEERQFYGKGLHRLRFMIDKQGHIVDNKSFSYIWYPCLLRPKCHIPVTTWLMFSITRDLGITPRLDSSCRLYAPVQWLDVKCTYPCTSSTRQYYIDHSFWLEMMATLKHIIKIPGSVLRHKMI